MKHVSAQPVVLFAVLNWGLGHASRSIPLINSLLNKSFDVVICSDGIALDLLKKEFPNLKHEVLPGYNVSYKFESIIQNILWHFKDILAAVAKEKKEIERLKEKHNALAVISDNRYGCYFDEGYSVIMSHQLSIQTEPLWKGKFASNILNKYINKFSICWIPDFEGPEALAGELSKNKSIKNKNYIGCISRFESLTLEKKYDLAIVLSGPEPARSNLEELLTEQAKGLDQSMVLVRGTNLDRPDYLYNMNAEIFDLCLGTELNEIICQSQNVICRSGYSSVMDFKKIGKKAILIPTPGQTEQEYLAKYLMDAGIFYSTSQKDFSLLKALANSGQFNGFELHVDDTLMEVAIEDLINKIKLT